jgi:hypothetical protein
MMFKQFQLIGGREGDALRRGMMAKKKVKISL